MASSALPTASATGAGEDGVVTTNGNDPSSNTVKNEASRNGKGEEDKEEEDRNGVTECLPPSHILEDGRFIYLPPPNPMERSRFFERSIARHGLLQADMMGQESMIDKGDGEDDSDDKNKKKRKVGGDDGIEEEDEEQDKTTPRVHPLAVASARLQSNGLAELNRAINLAGLVTTGEFFSLSNIVDPSLEVSASSATAGADHRRRPTGDTASLAEQEMEAKTRALFVLKRKRVQFEKATTILERHERRLRAALTAQRVIDRRLFQLRQQWRLVAPEHGTRARLHAARPTEVVAIDIDVYDRDRVGGGNQALRKGGSANSASGVGGGGSAMGIPTNKTNAVTKPPSFAGRLASRVPRFATIELRDDYKVDVPSTAKEESEENDDGRDEDGDLAKKPAAVDDAKMSDSTDADQAMEVDDQPVSTEDDVAMNDTDDGDKKAAADDTGTAKNEVDAEDTSKWTRGEPFAVADPTLGRVMENFDPSKVPMLNLQLDIQKSSTGFLQSACLEPMTTLPVAQGEATAYAQDEDLLVTLQHSLFCASLFESIRSELDPTSNVAGSSSMGSHPARWNKVPVAWLTCESDENFLPPPSMLVGGDLGKGLAPLCVVHCHEGEVKVQLDSEYTLCVKLVEANVEKTDDHNQRNNKKKRKNNMNSNNHSTTSSTKDGKNDNGYGSGSQSPEQLHALCRALLLHSQDVYHRHSLYLRERAKKKAAKEAALGDGPRGLARVTKEDVPDPPRILQSCVSLGSKMLFEQRIRKTLMNISKWLKKIQQQQQQQQQSRIDEHVVTNHNDNDNINYNNMHVDWVALSLFDLQSHFTLNFQNLTLDATIVRDMMTVTRVVHSSDIIMKNKNHGTHTNNTNRSGNNSTGGGGSGGGDGNNGNSSATHHSMVCRKVKFYSEIEFEMYLKMELRRQLR